MKKWARDLIHYSSAMQNTSPAAKKDFMLVLMRADRSADDVEAVGVKDGNVEVEVGKADEPGTREVMSPDEEAERLGAALFLELPPLLAGEDDALMLAEGGRRVEGPAGVVSDIVAEGLRMEEGTTMVEVSLGTGEEKDPDIDARLVEDASRARRHGSESDLRVRNVRQ